MNGNGGQDLAGAPALDAIGPTDTFTRRVHIGAALSIGDAGRVVPDLGFETDEEPFAISVLLDEGRAREIFVVDAATVAGLAQMCVERLRARAGSSGIVVPSSKIVLPSG